MRDGGNVIGRSGVAANHNGSVRRRGAGVAQRSEAVWAGSGAASGRSGTARRGGFARAVRTGNVAQDNRAMRQS